MSHSRTRIRYSSSSWTKGNSLLLKSFSEMIAQHSATQNAIEQDKFIFPVVAVMWRYGVCCLCSKKTLFFIMFTEFCTKISTLFQRQRQDTKQSQRKREKKQIVDRISVIYLRNVDVCLFAVYLWWIPFFISIFRKVCVWAEAHVFDFILCIFYGFTASIYMINPLDKKMRTISLMMCSF